MNVIETKNEFVLIQLKRRDLFVNDC